MTVAEFLVRAVSAMGCEAVFSVTGGMAMHVNRAVAEFAGRVIYCNHEQAVVAAADGYAKSKDYSVPGVAVVTSGPGVMNTVNSLASAYYDSVPLIVIAGQVKSADINRFNVRSYGPQETPQMDVVRPLAKAVLRYDPRSVGEEELLNVLAACMSGRKGPVFIEVPLDVQSLHVQDVEKKLDKLLRCVRDDAKDRRSVPSNAVDAFCAELTQCRRPAIVFGNGLHIAGVSSSTVRHLVESIQIPALFTWPSAGLLEYSHELNFGCPGGLAPTHANKILQQADLLLFLGVRLDLLTTAFSPQNFGKRAKRLIVDCDPAEIAKNVNLSNAEFFQEDIRHVLPSLVSAFVRPSVASTLHEQQHDWLAECRDLREKDRQEECLALGGADLTAYTMTLALSRAESAKYLVSTGSGFAVEAFARFFRPRREVAMSFAGHCLGSMGLALPMAIGAAVGLGQMVTCLEGDGGALFNVQELFTLAANPDIRLRIVVMNNGGYQSIIRSQRRAFGKEFGASADSGLFNARFDLLAQAAGIPYVRCQTLRDFEEALGRPEDRCIIDAILKEDGYRGPAVTTKFDPNGVPYSTDIEDVSWQRP